MPTVTSHFVIDLPTLFAVTVFISATGGLLLLFAWMQNRSTPALALWGIGYLFGAAAAALLGASGFLPNSWSVGGANALLCGAYGVMWGGSRSFEGRRIRISLIVAGAAIWVAAFQFEGFAESLQARVGLVSAILATYALLSVRELWHARDRELISRWPTLALVVLHTGFVLARIPFASALAFLPAAGPSPNTAVFVGAFEALFTAFCLPFLRVAMSKERAELEQRKAALTDSLTGIANRRAFFDRGGPLLEWAIADRRPAALLLFDLDRFKNVNDTAGHQAGDRVLKAFCDLVAASMRPSDLFGRVGGEEFACLVVNASMAQALQTAERVRREFEAMRFPGLEANATVSVGVAMASDAGRSLPALLAIADRALYRAKADGRNRVAPAPLVLVDTSAGETARRTAERLAMIAAPLAG
ncbi:MAG: GGDEF domain-containing protein [Xanthobacteraceae bacterium]